MVKHPLFKVLNHPIDSQPFSKLVRLRVPGMSENNDHAVDPVIDNAIVEVCSGTTFLGGTWYP